MRSKKTRAGNFYKVEVFSGKGEPEFWECSDGTKDLEKRQPMSLDRVRETFYLSELHRSFYLRDDERGSPENENKLGFFLFF